MVRSIVRSVLMVIACLGAQAPGACKEAVQLAFKFSPGEVTTYEVAVSGAGHVRSSEGELVPVGVQGSLSFNCRTVEVLADGSGRSEGRLMRADVEASIGQQRARFLYANGRLRWFANGQEHPPPNVDLSQLPLLGAPIVFTVAPNGRVSGDSSLLEALREAAPAIGGGQFPQVGEQVFPDGPVAVGETWRHTAQLHPLGPTAPITITTSRTLDSHSLEGGVGVAKISGYSEARLRAGQLSLSQGETEVRVATPRLRRTITSTEFFNTSEGRLLRADYEVAVSAEVSVGIEEEEREGGVEARFHVTVQAR
ncbi:MAG: hypothetical protein JSV79_09195 [Armatimonadota bacterium]|nr:MAG: hypothetical protein JSV79_09195 [Armatimonadota bacterium]